MHYQHLLFRIFGQYPGGQVERQLVAGGLRNVVELHAAQDDAEVQDMQSEVHGQHEFKLESKYIPDAHVGVTDGEQAVPDKI